MHKKLFQEQKERKITHKKISTINIHEKKNGNLLMRSDAITASARSNCEEQPKTVLHHIRRLNNSTFSAKFQSN